MYNSYFDSPIGSLEIVASDSHILAIKKVKSKKTFEVKENSLSKKAKKQLQEYFLNRRTSFDLPISFEGTDFQQKVWKALTKVAFGKTASYGDISKKINHPGAFRAVGASCKGNPILIIVPCHRVVLKNNKLGGFNLGKKTKQFLLQHECNNSQY